MKKIAIIGSSQLCSRLIYYFESTGFGDVVGMFDDFEPQGTIKNDRPLLGKITDTPALFKKNAFDAVAVAIGYKHRRFRRDTFTYLKQHAIPVATFVHPSSYVEKSVTIEEGAIILVDCTIEMNAHIYQNVFLSSRCYVSHDVILRAHSYCSASANLASGTEVGECCFLGINTTTIDGIRIGENVQTAAGAVITKDSPSHTLMAGVPAREKKKLTF